MRTARRLCLHPTGPLLRAACLSLGLLGGLNPAAAQTTASSPAPGWTAASPLGRPGLTALPGTFFRLSAPAGQTLRLSQVNSTVYELTGLQVSGLGNVQGAALEQQLRAELRALDSLGQSQSRVLQLEVLRQDAAGTELATRWQDSGAGLGLSSVGTGSGTGSTGTDSTGTGDTGAPTTTLFQTLLPGGGGVGGLRLESTDPALQRRYADLPSARLQTLTLGAAAPYGFPLLEGHRLTTETRQDMTATFGALLAAVPSLRALEAGAPGLPTPGLTGLPPLGVRAVQTYQGRNSRGDYLFQAQADAPAWQHDVSPARGQLLRLEVLDLARMSQAVYRADGLPQSAFDFSTMHLRLTHQAGGVTVSLTVQVRTTSALRPAGA